MKKTDNINIKDKIGPDKHYKIEAFRKEVRVTKPHKHNQYFEIIYLSAGSGYHWIDEKRYEVTPPVFFFLNRDQLHYWELTGEPEGFVVILKQPFLESSKDDVLKQLVQRVWFSNCRYLKKNLFAEQLLLLLADQNAMQNSYSSYIIDGLLKALLGAILAVGEGSKYDAGIPYLLYNQYLELLFNSAFLSRKVSFYAGKLKTTPQYLNIICRKAAGSSASGLLNTQVMAEAKRLLNYTDKNVTEIGYQLNFKDPSYFVKFFKKHQTQTPEEYRRLFQNHHK